MEVDSIATSTNVTTNTEAEAASLLCNMVGEGEMKRLVLKDLLIEVFTSSETSKEHSCLLEHARVNQVVETQINLQQYCEDHQHCLNTPIMT